MIRSRGKSKSNVVPRITKTILSVVAVTTIAASLANARVADRGRVVKARNEASTTAKRMNHRSIDRRRAATKPQPVLEGPKYRGRNRHDATREAKLRKLEAEASEHRKKNKVNYTPSHDANGKRMGDPSLLSREEVSDLALRSDSSGERELGSQLTGCCYSYQSYSSNTLGTLYGKDLTQGDTPSHDSGDEDCTTDGLSFIGVSFSVNTAHGNPYTYHLNDQFPMENIIDRDYNYVMSMDEDGWLVGGGYKAFDYSGKMPYIDSSHTELLRVGNMNPAYGGTSITQVYNAMASLSFAPLSIYPEYVKGGGGGGDDGSGYVPSADITFIVSVVETYTDDSYSDYEKFLNDLFNAFDAVGGGSCMDDHDTDPHVSMSRGVKFKSSTHQYNYFYTANLEVAVWQSIYPKGVVIGSDASAAFPPGSRSSAQYVGYGSLYFFYDRANITRAWAANRDMYSSEEYYSTLFAGSDSDSLTTLYSAVTTVGYDWQAGSGSGDNEQQEYEHNPYNWKATMAMHDMTDGWDLPPNCYMEGETFLGIPLAANSDSKLQSSSSFQNQFDFDSLCDFNYTYIVDFGTNHGWLVGEHLDNAVGSIVDKDTAHIPLFYLGTTNPNMGGMTLSNMIKVAKAIDFGTLYIKPAFVFADDNGHLKLQFEADSSSALGYLYNNLCSLLGISWNYNNPVNDYGYYTSCAMHAAGDKAAYGCGPDNSNTGGFCPQMTIAYSAKFGSEDQAAAYLSMANTYVDYWRSLYPSGVAVGTSNFCSEGGCLGLFLNRMDVYQVFKPDSAGSWVEFNGGTFSPTASPAPTYQGGCDDPRNKHLDKCFRMQNKRKASVVAWDSLGTIGQLSILLVAFMATTLTVSIFLSRARRRKRKGESYVGFFLRDLQRTKKKKKKLRKRKKGGNDLEEDMLGDDRFGGDDDAYNPGPKPRAGRSSRSKSGSRSTRSRSRKSSDRSASRKRGSSRSRKKENDDGEDKSRRSKSKSRTRSRQRSRSSSRRGRDDGGDDGARSSRRDRDSSRSRRQLV